MAAGMDQESIVRRELTSRCISIVRYLFFLTLTCKAAAGDVTLHQLFWAVGVGLRSGGSGETKDSAEGSGGV